MCHVYSLSFSLDQIPNFTLSSTSISLLTNTHDIMQLTLLTMIAGLCACAQAQCNPLGAPGSCSPNCPGENCDMRVNVGDDCSSYIDGAGGCGADDHSQTVSHYVLMGKLSFLTDLHRSWPAGLVLGWPIRNAAAARPVNVYLARIASFALITKGHGHMVARRWPDKMCWGYIQHCELGRDAECLIGPVHQSPADLYASVLLVLLLNMKPKLKLVFESHLRLWCIVPTWGAMARNPSTA